LWNFILEVLENNHNYKFVNGNITDHTLMKTLDLSLLGKKEYYE